MEFNKKQFDEFRNDFTKTITDMEKKYDVKIKLGNISYDDLEFTSKITVSKNEKFTEESERLAFEKVCVLYKLKPTDYKRQFMCRGKRYEVIGLEISRPKYPIKVRELSTGKITLFVEDVLKDLE